MVKGLAAPIATLKKFKNALLGVQKQSGRKFGVPQMIGMSILYSTVFGMISGIKQAIADGTNNLVQYSSEYNKSISSIVSALLYLKNAWAAAFAPIVNVVGPYIQSFINMIASALNAVGKFMAALTGKGLLFKPKRCSRIMVHLWIKPLVVSMMQINQPKSCSGLFWDLMN